MAATLVEGYTDDCSFSMKFVKPLTYILGEDTSVSDKFNGMSIDLNGAVLEVQGCERASFIGPSAIHPGC
jgi:hypothetical protein